MNEALLVLGSRARSDLDPVEQGRAGNEETQHEPERAEDADAAVSHDRQPALRIHAGQPVEAIGEPVEVKAAGEQLPHGYGDQPGQE